MLMKLFLSFKGEECGNNRAVVTGGDGGEAGVKLNLSIDREHERGGGEGIVYVDLRRLDASLILI